MNEFQQRVVIEHAELSIKVEKLAWFIGHDIIYPTLPAAERARLAWQSRIMVLYQEVLTERIAAFAP